MLFVDVFNADVADSGVNPVAEKAVVLRPMRLRCGKLQLFDVFIGGLAYLFLRVNHIIVKPSVGFGVRFPLSRSSRG
jgi:hypothetical protein